MTKYIIFIFFCSVLTTFGQTKKIKIKKENVISDTINIIGVWNARPFSNEATNTIWEFKTDGTFIEKRGYNGSFYNNRPNGKYNFTNDTLDIFQTVSQDQTYNVIYTVVKKKDCLLLTITENSKNTGYSKRMKLTKRLN